MKTVSIRVANIEVGNRHRARSADAVSLLARSIRENGLRHPITIRIVEEMVVDGEKTGNVPVLIAGFHRLEAVKQIGWEYIDCAEVDDDAIAAELWELAENLHRCDLSKEQRDEHIRRYAELLEARKSLVPQNAVATEMRKDGRRKGPQHEKGIARQIADATGLSDDTVRRALNPEPSPPKPAPREPSQSAVEETALPVALPLAPSAAPPAAAMAEGGEPPAAKEPAQPPATQVAKDSRPVEPQPTSRAVEGQLNRLIAAWESAGAEAREAFRDIIGEPAPKPKKGRK